MTKKKPTKFKYDYEWWVPKVFGTLEGTKPDGTPFFAVLYCDTHWGCDDLEMCHWLNDTGRVWSMGNPYGGRCAALGAAKRKYGGKMIVITEEEYLRRRVKSV